MIDYRSVIALEMRALLADALARVIAVWATGATIMAMIAAASGDMDAAFAFLIGGAVLAQFARLSINRADSLYERARAAERIEAGEDADWREAA